MTCNPTQPTIALGAPFYAHVVERVRVALRARLQAARSLRRDNFAEERRAADSIAHLNVHVLKDIGAPHWLIARAASSRDEEALRWTEIERR